MRKRKALYRVIDTYRGRYSLQAMCRKLDILPGTYYKWKRTHLEKESKDLFLVGLIREIHSKNRQIYGYRRMRIALLREHGLVINHKALQRIMSQYNLLSVIRRKYRYRKSSEAWHRYENILQRNFQTAEPNRKWLTDISYIPTKEGNLFLSCIKDCCTGQIVSYRYSTNFGIQLAMETVKAALKKEKVAGGLILHSDQGVQYTSHEYFTLTKSYNIQASMSRPGTPYDNAPMESFFSALKTECLYLQKPKTIQEAKDLIDDYIDFYNNFRVSLVYPIPHMKMSAG